MNNNNNQPWDTSFDNAVVNHNNAVASKPPTQFQNQQYQPQPQPQTQFQNQGDAPRKANFTSFVAVAIGVLSQAKLTANQSSIFLQLDQNGVPFPAGIKSYAKQSFFINLSKDEYQKFGHTNGLKNYADFVGKRVKIFYKQLTTTDEQKRNLNPIVVAITE